MTRVLVTAASAVSRAGLEAILARDPAIVVVGSAKAGTSLADEIVEHEPDVLVLEFAGGDDDALTILHVVSGDLDDGVHALPAVVVLTDDEDAASFVGALGARVRGLLPRDARPHEIVAAVSAAAAGLVAVTSELFATMRSNGTPAAAPSRTGKDELSRETPLTPRELEVLRMIADGLGNKQIAARLAISEHTVKFHVGSVFAKTHASTRAEAVMIGARRGLIVV
ncbi:MAG TPA: response regulator transcription factor [Gemmatimonadaceae bacterium]|nr:response regulator transcription factor [Gemmatimonadaceae bacterium]